MSHSIIAAKSDQEKRFRYIKICGIFSLKLPSKAKSLTAIATLILLTSLAMNSFAQTTSGDTNNRSDAPPTVQPLNGTTTNLAAPNNNGTTPYATPISSDAIAADATNQANEGQKKSVLLDQIGSDLANSLLSSGKIHSLMLLEEESRKIDMAIEALKAGKEYTSVVQATPQEEEAPKDDPSDYNRKSYIYLASMFYYDANNWVIWLNDRTINNDTNKQGNEFYVTNISKASVDLLWTLSFTKWKILSGKDSQTDLNIDDVGKVRIRFSLKPNQTYNLVAGKIVEGKVVAPNPDPTNATANKDGIKDNKVMIKK